MYGITEYLFMLTATHREEDDVSASVRVGHEPPGGEERPLVRRQQQPLERVVV